MSWTAILLLASGAYVFKALGLVVLGPAALARTDAANPDVPAADPGILIRIGQLLPAALLAALVVSQTVVDGQELVVDARLPGVAAGAVAVWRGAPCWLVLVVAAAVTAAIRAL